eukprot:TRINITY_DN657_c0_g1_i7.p1 TRINITY_DN657_c0_g1~~TRINITY_DN657_c0_g1_i7.p1  ORF type:complete len:373 (+),score=87.23 TRINITY_DN657_c0_g1_i7:740-1858(+)
MPGPGKSADTPSKRKREEAIEDEEVSASEEEEEEEEEEDEEEGEESCESSGTDDSGEPAPLVIDKHGRVEFGGTLGAAAGTAVVWDNVLDAPSAGRCRGWCRAAAVQAKVKKGRAYSRGSTFWVGCDDQPRCLPEILALQIFQQHARGAEYDPKRSGAEWWTLVLDGDSEVGWHWDKDYALEEPLQMNIYPHVATVTYLSDWGAPTFVARSVAPPMVSDAIPPTIEEYHFTYPKTGRHMAFDGRFLHGSKAVRHRAVPKGECRVTILVNVWLNHRPITTKRFKTAVNALPAETMRLDFSARTAPAVLPPSSAEYHLAFTAALGRSLSVALRQPPASQCGHDVAPAAFTIKANGAPVGTLGEAQAKKKRKTEK